MDDFSDILISVAFFAAVVLSLYFFLRSRHEERMAMIEKGFEFKKENKSKAFLAIKTGIFLIGIALGLFFGYLLKEYTTVDDVIAFFSMVLFFGGISLVVNHFIALKLDKHQN